MGQLPITNQAPSGATEMFLALRDSLENVSLVVFDLVLLQKRDQFLFEGHLPMMFLLLCDIIQNRLLLRMTYAERRVARLPRKRLFLRKLAMNPAAGVCLDLAHDLRQCGFCGQRKKNMNVIGRTVDEQCSSAKLTDNTAQVRKQARLEFRVHRRCAVFRAENNVKQQVGVGVSHDSIAPPGLDVLNLGTHGSRRGLPSHGAPRLPHAQARSIPSPEPPARESDRGFGRAVSFARAEPLPGCSRVAAIDGSPRREPWDSVPKRDKPR